MARQGGARPGQVTAWSQGRDNNHSHLQGEEAKHLHGPPCVHREQANITQSDPGSEATALTTASPRLDVRVIVIKQATLSDLGNAS